MASREDSCDLDDDFDSDNSQSDTEDPLLNLGLESNNDG
jgi:hypothetical protein